MVNLKNNNLDTVTLFSDRGLEVVTIPNHVNAGGSRPTVRLMAAYSPGGTRIRNIPKFKLFTFFFN